MAGKKVSLNNLLAELKAVIDDLEKEDPAWSDAHKKQAKKVAAYFRGVRETASADCTDGTQMPPIA
jgi:hypothetical protein